MENMTKEQEDELKQDIHAFTLVKALDLLDDCHHYLKANPPSKETMNYNKWENLIEETDYMREYNADAAHERANSDIGNVAAPKGESDEFYKLHLFEYSYSDKKELPISLLRKMHEAMFYWVRDSHPNQKYKTEYYDLSVRATQVALSELASLRQQLKEREESIKEFMHLTSNWDRYTKADMEAIRDRAKALLDKQ